jgi:hypothetical protein
MSGDEGLTYKLVRLAFGHNNERRIQCKNGLTMKK